RRPAAVKKTKLDKLYHNARYGGRASRPPCAYRFCASAVRRGTPVSNSGSSSSSELCLSEARTLSKLSKSVGQMLLKLLPCNCSSMGNSQSLAVHNSDGLNVAQGSAIDIDDKCRMEVEDA
ncbi:hypothetical protein Tcan_17705, partial [Toxocara canis]